MRWPIAPTDEFMGVWLPGCLASPMSSSVSGFLGVWLPDEFMGVWLPGCLASGCLASPKKWGIQESRHHKGFQTSIFPIIPGAFGRPSSRSSKAFLDSLDSRRICGCLDSQDSRRICGCLDSQDSRRICGCLDSRIQRRICGCLLYMPGVRRLSCGVGIVSAFAYERNEI